MPASLGGPPVTANELLARADLTGPPATPVVVGGALVIPAGLLAQRRGLWMHVDACVGGYFAPFARMADDEPYTLPTTSE